MAFHRTGRKSCLRAGKGADKRADSAALIDAFVGLEPSPPLAFTGHNSGRGSSSMSDGRGAGSSGADVHGRGRGRGGGRGGGRSGGVHGGGGRGRK
jgi:membrane protein involved in colicin uptake